MRFIYLFMLMFSCSSWSYTVGNQSLLITTDDPQRQLSVRLFYPTRSEAPSVLQGNNSVFQGFAAIPDASLAAGKFPMVVLSHGSGGNNTSLAWLATQLARHGIIVLAANHPGSTTGDSRATTDVTLQTRDISIMLNVILRDARWGSV
ncbi:alpha/beta hydrolase family protein, partial [Winslowiella iniecta]|uniref:alpha/beta hydrolase family protein n=1 Tax=Winslowiella iniecta TaxID=1560201 RepID=UPI003B97E4F4